jgi:hypothetical protein
VLLYGQTAVECRVLFAPLVRGVKLPTRQVWSNTLVGMLTWRSVSFSVHLYVLHLYVP